MTDAEPNSIPLDSRQQHQNAFIYAAVTSLMYLGAPALYVGFVQASLCKHLHTSNTMANLPSTVFLAMAWVSYVVAWLIPQARLLKTTLGLSYGLMAGASALVPLALVADLPNGIVVGSLILHAAVVGSANGVVSVLNWEALGRGVSERYRGKAMAWAFGWGPGFAVVGALGAQLVLQGSLFGWSPPRWLVVPYPYNYVMLFGASTACMALAAGLVRRYQIPLPKKDAERESFQKMMAGGIKSFLAHRVLLVASVAYLLIYCANMVQNNMNLFTWEAVGRMPEELAGYQLLLRFSFKIGCGFFLGWLMIRTNPKVPLLVTLGLQVVGVLWVLFVPGYWFMLAFGLNGAGELFGVYYVNYPMLCSAKSQIRRNLSLLTLLSSLVGLSPVFYGWISDTWSIRASFWAALAILAFTTWMVGCKLPARPRTPAENLSEEENSPKMPG